MAKPKEYDFQYREWFRDEWPRRTWYGKSQVVAILAIVAFAYAFAFLVVGIPQLVKEGLLALTPDVYKDSGET